MTRSQKAALHSTFVESCVSSRTARKSSFAADRGGSLRLAPIYVGSHFHEHAGAAPEGRS